MSITRYEEATGASPAIAVDAMLCFFYLVDGRDRSHQSRGSGILYRVRDAGSQGMAPEEGSR